MPTKKPTAKVVSEVCSVCGQDWQLHGKTPTLETCVRLLLDEIRSLNSALAARPIVQPINIPYPVYPRPYWPHWYTTWGGTAAAPRTSGGTITYTQSAVTNLAATTPTRLSLSKAS